ncbi:KpsF/GutQ family protein [Rhizobium rhizosphaerae]|uniref:KpsF/GutQ family protein n=1 Tax=Xaviernesmea rhizosphaerae TaxID=1672749 RepID=A0A1Q9AE26_9HYPH|nr:KpsF/GutQ family sugar-phosphate isomerase [Xaviernesmea rhizosphaerae]OLP53202.1 KpsF/GutQ family protein [Xaviernesmea rhizosphaerae]
MNAKSNQEDLHSRDALQASIGRTIATTVSAVAAFSACFATDPAFASSLVDAVELIGERRGRTIVAGIGKSGHIGRKIAATLSSTGTSAYFVHPAEASHGDLGMITEEDTLILLSWSGETVELASIITYARRFQVPIVSITGNADSLLARNSAVAIVLPKVQEACPHGLAPTTSTLLQLAVGDALAIALLERRGFSPEDFRTFHPGGKLGAQLQRAIDLAHTGAAMPILPVGSPMSLAVIEMSSKGFGVVGIVDGAQRLIGVITDGDLRRHMSDGMLSEPVEAVMSHSPRVIRGDILASAALKSMQTAKRVTVLFVVDETGAPEGILHIHDLLRAGVA